MNNPDQFLFSKSPWEVIFIFILFIGAFGLQFHLHYPDEMYYSDAAVIMMQTRDYLTTYLGDETLRFKKPIITYWAVLAGFKLFGITPFASRIFFLLAGAVTVGLVYRISRITFDDTKIQKLSLLIIASHPVLIFSATRSIPDVLLALFMTLSGLGFAGLLKWGNKASDQYIWLIYLGIALAFEVKGLPAAALGGIGIIYLKFNPWQTISWKKLFNIPAILISLFIAFFWFVFMYKIHGSAYLDSFFEDQVGTRVSSKILQVITNLILGTVLLVILFVPWFLFGFQNLKKNLAEIKKVNIAFTGFVFVWVLSIILMSGFVSKFFERYLLPVIPMTSVWLAYWLIKCEIFKQIRLQKIANSILLFLNGILILAGLFLNIGLGAQIIIYLGIIAGILFWLYLLRVWWIGQKLIVSICYSILLLFYLGSFVTYQISLPDQGQQAKIFLSNKNIEKNTKIAFLGHLHTSSKIRIGIDKDFRLINLPQEDYKNRLSEFNYFIIEDRYIDQFDENIFHAEKISTNWNPKIILEMFKSILKQNSEEVIEQKGKKYYWLTKNINKSKPN